MKKFYAQASKSNLLRIEDIVQVKEAFPTLSVDKVEKVLKIKIVERVIRSPRST